MECQHAKLGFLQNQSFPRMGLTCFNRPGDYRLSCRNSRRTRDEDSQGMFLEDSWQFGGPHCPQPQLFWNARKARACAFFQAPFPRARSGCRAADGKVSLFSCFHTLKLSLSRHSARRCRMAPALRGSVNYRSEAMASSPGCLTLLTGGLPNLMLLLLCSLKLHTAGWDSGVRRSTSCRTLGSPPP